MRKGAKFERTKHRETILDLGRFLIRPKFRKSRLVIKWNGPFRFGPIRIFGTNFKGGSL